MQELGEQVFLVTGGTGSFGEVVTRRLLEIGVPEVRIFSRDEKKQEDLRISLNSPRVKFYIGDVRDYSSVKSACVGVDCIFHAAALKQVPSCEFYPMEAIKTNVLGTENVLRAVQEVGVKRLVALSTDKAVYPINAMGMTKALMEKVVVAASWSSLDSILTVTRYGNVMASRGSVIPLFIKQLQSGAPLTVTDPNMTRFMMNLEESVDLVMHAFSQGSSGDIFVQKSPASTVLDIALALRELLQKDNEIKIIGTRHGEKLYESLVSREEMARAEEDGVYFRIPADSRDLNYNQYFVDGESKISLSEDYTSHGTVRLNLTDTKKKLLELAEIQACLVHA